MQKAHTLTKANDRHDSTGDLSAEEWFLGMVAAGKDPWMATVAVDGTPVAMKIDSGADMTVIPTSEYELLGAGQLQLTVNKLTDANSSSQSVGVFQPVLSTGKTQHSVQDVLC